MFVNGLEGMLQAFLLAEWFDVGTKRSRNISGSTTKEMVCMAWCNSQWVSLRVSWSSSVEL